MNTCPCCGSDQVDRVRVRYGLFYWQCSNCDFEGDTIEAETDIIDSVYDLERAS